MRHFRKIPFWENKARQEAIEKFATLLEDFYGYANPNCPEARNSRKEINLAMNNVHTIILKARIAPRITYSPPPIIGGYIKEVNVILNYDNLAHYEIPKEKVFDFLHITLGKYRDDYNKSIIRTYNPLFWLGYIIDYLVGLPFALFGWFGFDRDKAEYSFFGRFVKGIIKLVAAIGIVFGVLQQIGYMEPVKNYIHKQVDTYILKTEPQVENQEQPEVHEKAG